MIKNHAKKPEWLKNRLKNPQLLHDIKRDLRCNSLHTVCESAKCPNIGECFSRKTATFMILGDVCTRNCAFCAVNNGAPNDPDPDEPGKIAEMVEKLGLKHVVITSVTRDDLPDGGAAHFAAVIRTLRQTENFSGSIEVLTPDFSGDKTAIKNVLDAGPDIFNHNLETVRRLSKTVRNKADYDQSLAVLAFAGRFPGNIYIKSGLMVGLGETDAEILKTLDDLRAAGCNIVTIGQYLRPSLSNLPVDRYVEPALFEKYREYGESIGIEYVFSGPLVRSSYLADSSFDVLKKRGRVVIPTNVEP